MMSGTKVSQIVLAVFGLLLICLGLAVFLIRLGHAGPYAIPHGVAPFAAIGLLVMGALLFWSGRPRVLTWILVLISPVVMFPALYSIVGESEEVISLYAKDPAGNSADLRLWIVDRDDGAWVGMPRAKAIENGLDGARLEMLRSGERSCVVPKLADDREVAGAIHAMKVQKYKAAQFASAIGLYPKTAGESTVALRLDPCG